MATLAQLQAQLTSIQNARNSGALIVRHGDTMTTFRSLDDMDRIIAGLQDQINAANDTPRKRVTYIRQDSKGYGQ